MLKPYIPGDSARSHTQGLHPDVQRRSEHQKQLVDSAICFSNDGADAPKLTFKKLTEYRNCKFRPHEGLEVNGDAHDENEDAEIGPDGTLVIRGFNTNHTRRTASTHPEQHQPKSAAYHSLKEDFWRSETTQAHVAYPGHSETDRTTKGTDYDPNPYRHTMKTTLNPANEKP